ncbi:MULTISPECIES: hypothetical protein [Nostocaceae]|nr:MULTISPECIES: hypothetical protein [Nostocaceae]
MIKVSSDRQQQGIKLSHITLATTTANNLKIFFSYTDGEQVSIM